MSDPAQMSKRERQIMDVIWEKGEATVSQVQEGIPSSSRLNFLPTFCR